MNSTEKSRWSYSSWGKSAQYSKYFDSFKVYIVDCYNEYESFIKIGKTYTTVERRFSLEPFPYNYKIIDEIIFSTAEECSSYEKELHRRYKTDRYYPLIDFKGGYECFEKTIIKDIKMKQKFNTIIIDGDYLAYMGAFVTQTERYFVRDYEGDIVIDYPTLKSCENYLIKQGLNIEKYSVTKEKVVHKNWEYISRNLMSRKVEAWKKDVRSSPLHYSYGVF